MNIENINAAINLFQKLPASRISMDRYYALNTDIKDLKSTTSALKCGTVGCFAGWVGTLKEFRQAGGTIKLAGLYGTVAYPALNPKFGREEVPKSIAKFFGISRKNAQYLCGYSTKGQYMSHTNPVYGVRNNDVQPQHIVTALQKLLQGN